MMFQQAFEEWMSAQIANETNPRRRARLQNGLSHSTMEFLRKVWFPAIGNFDHLHAEWEVRDFHGGYRYLDLAYMPGDARGGIEIQDYRSHARDLDVRRFKDLCWRQALLALDGWFIMPVAFLSIQDETQRCKQLVLAFIGRFISIDRHQELGGYDAEAVRYARRLLRPFTAAELAGHLGVSDRQARRILHRLVAADVFVVASGKLRYRTYQCRRLTDRNDLKSGKTGFLKL